MQDLCVLYAFRPGILLVLCRERRDYCLVITFIAILNQMVIVIK